MWLLKLPSILCLFLIVKFWISLQALIQSLLFEPFWVLVIQFQLKQPIQACHLPINVEFAHSNYCIKVWLLVHFHPRKGLELLTGHIGKVYWTKFYKQKILHEFSFHLDNRLGANEVFAVNQRELGQYRGIYPWKKLKTVYMRPVNIKNLQRRELNLVDALNHLSYVGLHMYEAELDTVRHNHILQDFLPVPIGKALNKYLFLIILSRNPSDGPAFAVYKPIIHVNVVDFEDFVGGFLGQFWAELSIPDLFCLQKLVCLSCPKVLCFLQ